MLHRRVAMLNRWNSAIGSMLRVQIVARAVWQCARRLFAVAGLLVIAACKSSNRAVEVPDIDQAQAALQLASVPPRPQVLALAQRIAARAQAEGPNARAAAGYELAAKLTLAAYRQYAQEQDGREAVLLLSTAARYAPVAERCRLALQSAWLTGEVAGDPQSTALDLYRVERRFPAGCDSQPKFAKLVAAFAPTVEQLRTADAALVADGVAMSPASGAPSAVAVSHAELSRIDSWVGPDNARIVIVLSGPAAYRVGDAPGPLGTVATYIDVEETQLAPTVSGASFQGIVAQVTPRAEPRGVRVLIGLDGKGFRKVFHLTEPYRIVVDLARKLPKASTSRQVSRVVLDAGHGGTDPGAIGEAGTYEKDITLDLVHRVAPMLAARGIQVVLTRDDDTFVSLEERTARANASGADLFLSVHCNAAENRSRHGIETYVLDTQTSDMAGRVAARENATTTHANAELSSILANMRIHDQSTRSVHLAELLQRAALASVRSEHPKAHDGGVHQAGFYVLVGARMPGVLFESSYLSNTEEGVLLASASYRQQLAFGIANAVLAYRDGR
jgi:N-acetylmuramoyl-L-alanine amidase